jgi:DNA-directed RNA polymerase specialized sigma24 family protein
MAVAVARAWYDEWATARTPVLLRLAYLLTGDDDAAERLVTAALDRVGPRWHEIVRIDDPDRYARRLILAARGGRGRGRPALHLSDDSSDSSDDTVWRLCVTLPDRQRAAVVLRYFEDLDDHEIADLQGCSVGMVRSQLNRALATLGAGVARGAGPVTADQLGRLVREAFLVRSARAAGQVTGRAAPGVEAEPGPRRRRVWLASVAVLAVVAAAAGLTHESRSEGGMMRYAGVSIPSGWRYESYAGVQLRVPPTWGWGGAPIRGTFNDGRLGSCGTSQAFSQPGSASGYVPVTTPFVGRPAVLSDVCMSWGSDGVMPGADAVWFDSPLPIGEQHVGTRTAETRDAWDQHVTVFSADPALRREVLASVERVDVDANGCPTRAIQEPSAGVPDLTPSSLSVCVYSQDTGAAVLLWSARRDATVARAYLAAFGVARGPGTCARTPQGEWVALGVQDDAGGKGRWDVLDLQCSRLVGHGASASLTVADVRPWAGEGMTAYVGAPQGADPRIAAYFRAPLG